jgi:hypothetical protein
METLMGPTRTVETEIFIAAPPDAVWAVLTDGARYGAWNPFIRALSGPVEPGARLTIAVHPAGGRAMTFRPRVLVADPARELRWLGRLVLPGLFDGEHSFRLMPEREGTRLIHAETFRGLLVGLVDINRFRADFTAMNEALKARAERGTSVAKTAPAGR